MKGYTEASHQPSGEFLKKDCNAGKAGCLLVKKPLVGHVLAWLGSQEVIRIKLMEFARLMQIRIWLCAGRAQCRKEGTCLLAVSEWGSIQGWFKVAFYLYFRFRTLVHLVFRWFSRFIIV